MALRKTTLMNLAAAAVVSFCASAKADVLEINVRDFTVFAGQSLSTGQNVQITGMTGANLDVWFGNGVSVQGNVFAGGDLSAGNNTTLVGRALANDRIDLGSNVSVGRLDAGGSGSDRYVTVGSNGSIESIYASGDVSVGNNGVVAGGIYSGASASLGNNSSVAGRVQAVSDVGVGNGVGVGRVDAGRDISVSSGAVTGGLRAGDDVSIGSATVNGDVHAGDDGSLNGNGVIHGNVTYGDKFSRSKSSVVDGTVAQGTAESPDLANDGPDSFQTTLRECPTFTCGSTNLYYDSGQTVTLAPGSYGTLSVGADATLYLSAGVYDFANIWLDGSVRIIADTTGGDVVVNSYEDLGTGSGVNFSVNGTGKLVFQARNDLDIGRDSTIQADLLAFNDLRIDRDTSITGFLYATGGIWLDYGVNVMGGGSAAMVAGGQVPEPGTLAVLALGGLTMLTRLRRRATLA